MRVVVTSPVTRQAGTSDPRPAGKRVSGKRNRPPTWAKAELESWLAAAVASPPDSISAVTAQTVDTVSEAVADAVIDALHQNGYRWSDADHVVCAFLAATARAMQELQGQFDRAVERIVSLVLASRRRDHRLEIPEPVAKVAAQAAVDRHRGPAVVEHAYRRRAEIDLRLDGQAHPWPQDGAASRRTVVLHLRRFVHFAPYAMSHVLPYDRKSVLFRVDLDRMGYVGKAIAGFRLPDSLMQ